MLWTKSIYSNRFVSSRLKEHIHTNNDPRIRHLLIETLMKSGSNEEMLQAVRNLPCVFLCPFESIRDCGCLCRTCHFERLEREMNDDSSLDGGRFDSGTMGDLDRMVRSFEWTCSEKTPLLLYSRATM